MTLFTPVPPPPPPWKYFPYGRNYLIPPVYEDKCIPFYVAPLPPFYCLHSWLATVFKKEVIKGQNHKILAQKLSNPHSYKDCCVPFFIAPF